LSSRILFQGKSEINLKPIDPLFVAHARVVEDSGPVRIDSTSTNSYISGFSKGTFEKFGGFDRNLLEAKIKTPRLNFNGTYKAISHVFGIPVNGGGPYKVVYGKL
jgi:hypothetical protein